MKTLIILSIIFMGFTSDKPAYKLFNKNGKSIKYEKMLKELSKADIIFFGESHNNPISHWMELEITKDLAKLKENNITLGAEMFEADNQLIINEFLQDLVPEKKFEAEVRKWPNYDTDYKPLMSFAKENNLKFIATNIPRRYASIVFNKGFEGLNDLSKEAKLYIAPLPIAYDENVKCYADMIEMGKKMGHGNPRFPQSQAIKDATMSYFILKNIENNKIFIHYNGSYHSDNHEGIVWHIKKAKPELKILTITTIEQKNIKKLNDDDKNKADFIFVVPESMTKTY
ncbi:MAG: ChaN family lipoprotein [Chlorobi bacterium]|nr:ChaN family lipoprotein [Chlorobiota bacterium]